MFAFNYIYSIILPFSKSTLQKKSLLFKGMYVTVHSVPSNTFCNHIKVSYRQFSLFTRKAPDCCSCLITIHDRHLDIHKNKIIRTFRRSFHFFNCDFSIFCCFHFCPFICKISTPISLFNSLSSTNRILFPV